MITFAAGDITDSQAEAIVCTVNTVGVMGKGLAKACADRFAGLEEAYAEACEVGSVEIGSIWAHPTGLLFGPKFVACFATKRDWRNPSRIEWVERGVLALASWIEEESVSSIAVPPLGCGLGGLRWSDVEPIIRAALADARCEVELYPPT